MRGDSKLTKENNNSIIRIYGTSKIRFIKNTYTGTHLKKRKIVIKTALFFAHRSSIFFFFRIKFYFCMLILHNLIFLYDSI